MSFKMDMRNELIILGASGHAKVVLSTALACSEKVAGLFDDNLNLLNSKILDYPILGKIKINPIDAKNYSYVFGIGNNSKRKSLAETHTTIKNWKILIHPTAYVHPSAKIGHGTVIFAGAIIQPDTVIGEHCIINTGATVDHDCVIGNFSHLAPGVNLAGGVKIGEGVFFGIGSVAIQNIVVNDWVTVGAGGVVINNITAKKIVMGVPAKEKTTYANSHSISSQ